MYINPNWRILTVGDGDLSFSASLLNYYKPKKLTATIFDSHKVLNQKYGDEFFQVLQKQGCDVLTNFDVTNKNTWSHLKPQNYDLVIFQFPLIPAFSSKEDFQKQCKDVNHHISVNTLNRHLLRHFLVYSFRYFLDPKGENLCYITSKDVKPYREWDIENALLIGLKPSDMPINYLGQMKFDINNFPGYRIRNVDRDKHVKDTQGNTYVWSNKNYETLNEKLTIPDYINPDLSDKYCTYCRVGPFFSDQDKVEHSHSKRHKKMSEYEQQWLQSLNLV
ncbi:class I SAM-dependent methyltransferase [Pseudoalteromonas denitrificans]|nr:class I SAM-dependent methyltransferase [Pseudoalteromonas denitrificans]